MLIFQTFSPSDLRTFTRALFQLVTLLAVTQQAVKNGVYSKQPKFPLIWFSGYLFFKSLHQSSTKMENNILLTTKTHFFTLDDKVLLFGVCLFVVNLSIPTFRAVVHFPKLPRRLQFSRSCHWYEGNGSSSICDWLIITSTSPYTVTWSVSFKTGIGKPPKMPSSQSVLVCFSREKKI